ncbi:arylamine N-acetyltransferase 1-like [Pipistrellus kuhlii]|uniref:arylamine N-acetyltransferase 1-like n=1 Tax=Pipistrellus kuhlii TaxID=59472 RepID=UPI00174EED57|nr:arylamine N-acetyltransferase 1-like [Pipistrellus kuhlii]
MDIEAYFERIGYQNSRNKLDLETLTDILQHQIQTIPFENLNIHCGEPMELGLEAVFDQIVRKKRGGWCLQINQILHWALTTMGFDTTMLGSCVYNVVAERYGRAPIHLLLMVTLCGRKYIVDAGYGSSFQMRQPLELISGKDQPQLPCIFRLTEEGGTWHLDQIRREQYVQNQEFLNSELLEKKKYRKMYYFTLEPRKMEYFLHPNSYFQTSPESVFVKDTYSIIHTPDGVYGLVGFILIHRRFSYKDNMDLVEFKTLNMEEVQEVLKKIFNISLEKKFVPKHSATVFYHLE